MFPKIFIFFAFITAIVVYNTYHKPQVTGKIIAISQILPHPSLDRIRQGVEDEIKQAFGDKVKIEFQSAQGNPALATQIAQNFVGQKVDVLVAITTPSAQAMYSVNTSKIPLVFAGITDPISAKLVEKTGKNKEHVTGVSDAPDIDQQIELLQEFLPKNARIGIVYNPGETNSQVHSERLEAGLTKVGFKVHKTPAVSTSEVLQAAQTATANADALMLGNDNTVISALDAVLQSAKQKSIPVFCSDPESVPRGCAAAVAPDQYQMGRAAGAMVVRILKGEKAHHIPVLKAPSSRFTSITPNP